MRSVVTLATHDHLPQLGSRWQIFSTITIIGPCCAVISDERDDSQKIGIEFSSRSLRSLNTVTRPGCVREVLLDESTRLATNFALFRLVQWRFARSFAARSSVPASRRIDGS